MKIVKEFKEFAIKGNMFDMAIGIIIGVAFNKIVSSLVNDIILPSFGFVLGNVNFQNLKWTLQEESKNEAGKIIRNFIAINYGNFLQVLFDFFLISITVFVIIKVFNRIRSKAENVNDKTVPTPKDIQLLSEIRDILKSK